MKHSLSASGAQDVLSSKNHFKTKNLSFKYVPSSGQKIAFSVGRKKGNAVLRNKFKRKARALFLGELFKNISIGVLVHPLYKLNKNIDLQEDFVLFKKHLGCPENYE